jgi:hypothetical protein
MDTAPTFVSKAALSHVSVFCGTASIGCLLTKKCTCGTARHGTKSHGTARHGCAGSRRQYAALSAHTDDRRTAGTARRPRRGGSLTASIHCGYRMASG